MCYSELIQALNNILREQYPRVCRYGKDTTEGWHKPYFFVECVPYESNYESRNFVKKSCSMKITYFQETVNERDQLDKVEELRDTIGMKFGAGGRKVDVRDYTHGYVGEYNDILQISFRLEWYENRCQEPAGEKIETLDVTLRKGEL